LTQQTKESNSKQAETLETSVVSILWCLFFVASFMEVGILENNNHFNAVPFLRLCNHTVSASEIAYYGLIKLNESGRMRDAPGVVCFEVL
jgi:hypothetical protein